MSCLHDMQNIKSALNLKIHINWIFPVLVFITCSRTAFSTDAPCQDPSVLVVSNSLNQKSREGTYTLSSTLQCSGKKVWVQNSASGSYYGQTANYIYYNLLGNTWSGWMIGTDMCMTYGGIASMANDPPTPYDPINSGQWVEVYNGRWIQNPSLTVTCGTANTNAGPSMSAAAIVGIVIAVFCGLLLCVFITSCCCMAAKKKAIASQMNQIGGENSLGRPVYSVSGAMARRNTRIINPLPPDYYGNTVEMYSNIPITAPPYEQVCFDTPPPAYGESLHNYTIDTSAPSEQYYDNIPPPIAIIAQPEVCASPEFQENRPESSTSAEQSHTSTVIPVGSDIKVGHC